MKLLETELNNRTLRFDGVSIVDPERLTEMFMMGALPQQVRITHEDDEVAKFNAAVSDEDRLKLAGLEPISFDLSWQIPDKYKALDVDAYMQDAFINRVDQAYTPEQFTAGAERLITEMHEFARRGMLDVLRTIIYVIDEMTRTDQVWGVGRGSSCASYVLYLLGLHVVDPIRFNVALEEFMHD